jgi:hypothetical protein
MVGRRDLLHGGVLGGLVGAFSTDLSAEPAAAEVSDQTVEKIAAAITQLRTEMQSQRQFTEIAGVRDAQTTYLKSHGKLPDFMEIGLDVWFQVHDWHIRWQQTPTFGRDSLGRYTLLLMGTTLIMRVDAAANYLGVPYDAR